MNRSRFIERDFGGEGSERSQQLAVALAQIADPELLEALVHHVAAVHEYGGEFYVGAARDRFQIESDQLVRVEQGGTFLTYGHVVAYNKKARIKGQTIEPDQAYEEQSAPERDSRNGEVPEPAAVGPDPEQE
jgi:hypothetical protein